MSDTHDVTPAPSAAPAEVEPQAQVTSPQPDAPHERPIENLAAEVNRKFGKLQSQLDTAIQYMVASQQQATPHTVNTPAQGQPTDDELWASAQQGDRAAFDMLQDRRTDRKIAATLGTQQRTNIVAAQLQALTQRYPVLNDGTHPLTQTVQRAYQLLMQNGYPQGPATLLEAAKTAIADSPDIVSDLYTRSATTREQGRQSATLRSQAGVMGASSRQDAPPRQTTKAITPEEKALATRMGVKDPAGAKARFLKRQEDGQSHLGAVAGFVNLEDL